MLTVHELRKRGFKVQIRHHRCFADVSKFGSSKEEVLSKGGATEIFVTRPVPSHMKEGCSVGKLAIGIAECSPKDNYDRKRGVRIALGRALKQLGLCTK